MLMWNYLTIAIAKVGPKEGTFSAHPRIDPTTNQMYFFSGYCAYYVEHPTADLEYFKQTLSQSMSRECNTMYSVRTGIG